jgi:hypothetical protein
MILHIAIATSQAKPPKHMVEMTAYEAIVMLVVAALMVMSI